MIDRGEIDRANISMQAIRALAGAQPRAGRRGMLLRHNRSYIFFREAPVARATQAGGPIAAAKVPRIAGRSLAVDRLIHTFGFPFSFTPQGLTHLQPGTARSAPGCWRSTPARQSSGRRGDIFTGSGDVAGERAGTVRHDADFAILILKAAAET